MGDFDFIFCKLLIVMKLLRIFGWLVVQCSTHLWWLLYITSNITSVLPQNQFPFLSRKATTYENEAGWKIENVFFLKKLAKMHLLLFFWLCERGEVLMCRLPMTICCCWSFTKSDAMIVSRCFPWNWLE